MNWHPACYQRILINLESFEGDFLTTFIQHLREYVERGKTPDVVRRCVALIEQEFPDEELDLREISHQLLLHCSSDEVPTVLRTLTSCYHDWAVRLLDQMDDQLHNCLRINEMVLDRDREWLLPGNADFWAQLRNSFVALRGDIADFRSPRAKQSHVLAKH